jgi:hypothetical protein
LAEVKRAGKLLVDRQRPHKGEIENVDEQCILGILSGDTESQKMASCPVGLESHLRNLDDCKLVAFPYRSYLAGASAQEYVVCRLIDLLHACPLDFIITVRKHMSPVQDALFD